MHLSVYANSCSSPALSQLCRSAQHGTADCWEAARAQSRRTHDLSRAASARRSSSMLSSQISADPSRAAYSERPNQNTPSLEGHKHD